LCRLSRAQRAQRQGACRQKQYRFFHIDLDKRVGRRDMRRRLPGAIIVPSL
jgi:hypothetical protein